MSNLFNKIDSIDLTSILTEDENAIQKELDLEFSGKWSKDEILSESEIEINNILKEVSDSLAIMNESIEDLDKDEKVKLVESVLDRVEPRWTKSLRNTVLDKLGVSTNIKLKNSLKESEESIEEIQREISDLKSGMNGLDKSGQTEFEYNNQTYTKTSAGSRISSLESKLNSMNKDNNENRENGFGDEKLTEDTSKIDLTLDTLGEIEQVIETEGSIDQSMMLDRVRLAIEYLDEERFENVIDTLQGIIDIVETEGSIDQDIMLSKVKDAEEELGRLALNESTTANVTVDNIDQESKDKATIDKAIEIAENKDTIDNDTFRDLRLKLANKDYDMVDRSKDYALVRGEDVIYTWLRAEDIKDNLKEGEEPYKTVKLPNGQFADIFKREDGFYDANNVKLDDEEIKEYGLDESVHVNVSGGNVDVSTDNTNLSVDGDNVDVHVEDGEDLAPSVEITEPALEPVDSDVSAGEVIDEPVNDLIDEPTEEVLDTPEDLLDDSENLDEAAQDVLTKAGISTDVFEEALSEKFPNFMTYVLDATSNNVIISTPDGIVEYTITLTDNAIEIYPLGQNAGDSDVITLIDLPSNEIEDNVEESEGLQVSDIPAKNDQGKKGRRLELAKLESEEGKVSYRVSYLKEDDEELAGWDIDADTDEDAISSMDQFDGADEIADELLTAEFVETGIEGISSLNYRNTNILLSTDGEENIITVNQDNSDPTIFRGESFDNVLNQLIYWFIMNSENESEDETTPEEGGEFDE